MAKVRVYELAKELGLESKELLQTLNNMGEFVRSASSTIEAPVVRRLKEKAAATGSAPVPAAPARRPQAPAAVPTPAPAPAPSAPVEAPAAPVAKAAAAPAPPRQLRSPRLRPLRWPLPQLPPLQPRLRPRLLRQAVRPRPHPARPPRPRPLHPLRPRPHGRRPRMPARPPVRVRCPVPVAPVACPAASASPAHRVRATTRSPRARAWASSVPVPKVHRRPPPAVPASVPPSAVTVPAARVRPGTACRGPVAAWPVCHGRTRP